MSTKFFIFAAATAVLFSCTKIESEPQVLPDEPIAPQEYISLTLVNEAAEDTKAYYYETDSYWTFNWENSDMFEYFIYNNADYAGYNFAAVEKTASQTAIKYPTAGLDVGSSIYSALLQFDPDNEEGDYIYNEDPTSLEMVIPTYQSSTMTPEKYIEYFDASFTVTNAKLDTYSASGSGGVLKPVTIKSRTLTFKINGNLADFTYGCKIDRGDGGVSDFSYDAQGNATVTVEFANYATATGGNDSEDVLAKYAYVKVYNKQQDNNYVIIPVKAYRSGGGVKLSNYVIEEMTTNSKQGRRYVDGATKPYPIRNAMPCVSKSKLITRTILNYPEDISGSTTMYMLGSGAEFRVYSPSMHTGEKLVKAIVTTQEPCAGKATYNIISEDLTLRGFDACEIVSDVTECNFTVPATKGGSDSIYMVIAPGTHTGIIEIVTEDADGVKWSYQYRLAGKTFTRANRKPFAINLDNATPTQYVESGNGGSDEEEGL